MSNSDSEAKRIVKEPLLAPELSIDRITMLVYSPKLSLFPYRLDDSDDIMKKQAEDMIKNFINVFQRKFSHLIDTESFVSKDTHLYSYHFRLKGGIDFQFSTRYGIRNRITDKNYVSTFGSELDTERGYIDEYFDSDYNIRFEFNPNKNDIQEIKDFLLAIGVIQPTCSFCRLCRISRIDLAVDIPENINPALTDCSRAQNWFNCGKGRDVQTMNYGGMQSRHHFCIYDKKEEYKRQGIDYIGAYLWRFELRNHESFLIDFFPGFYDAWTRISIFQTGKFSDDPWLDMLMFYGSHFGMSTAFKRLPKSTQQRYRKLYQDFGRHESVIHPANIYLEQMGPVWDNFYSGLKSAFGRSNEPKGLFPHEAIAMGFMADNQVNQDKAQEFLTARMRKEFQS